MKSVDQIMSIFLILKNKIIVLKLELVLKIYKINILHLACLFFKLIK